MAVAVVHDIAASWADYHAVRSAMAGAPPQGLLVHAAGPTDEGFRTIDVWISEAAWHGFRERFEHLFDGLAVPPVVRELRVDHLITSSVPSDPDRVV